MASLAHPHSSTDRSRLTIDAGPLVWMGGSRYAGWLAY